MTFKICPDSLRLRFWGPSRSQRKKAKSYSRMDNSNHELDDLTLLPKQPRKSQAQQTARAPAVPPKTSSLNKRQSCMHCGHGMMEATPPSMPVIEEDKPAVSSDGNRVVGQRRAGLKPRRDSFVKSTARQTVVEEQRGLSWERRGKMSQKERARKALTGTWDDVVLPGLSAMGDAKRSSMVLTF